MFALITREIGELIEVFNSKKEAMECLDKFEKNDIEEGIYEPDFYEIVEQ